MLNTDIYVRTFNTFKLLIFVMIYWFVISHIVDSLSWNSLPFCYHDNKGLPPLRKFVDASQSRHFANRLLFSILLIYRHLYFRALDCLGSPITVTRLIFVKLIVFTFCYFKNQNEKLFRNLFSMEQGILLLSSVGNEVSFIRDAGTQDAELLSNFFHL